MPFNGVFIIFNNEGCNRKNLISKSFSSLGNSIVGSETGVCGAYGF